MIRNSKLPQILLDSDVIRHFINGNFLHLLESIYSERFVILDKVKHEICRSSSLKPIVENFINHYNIPIMPFPNDMAIIIEYAYLNRDFGVGESACMAVARHQKQFIASSNLKDIGKFCNEHGITYLTTMDILEQALKDAIMTKDDCDQFITDVLARGSKLPYTSMDIYIKSKL